MNSPQTSLALGDWVCRLDMSIVTNLDPLISVIILIKFLKKKDFSRYISISVQF